MNKPPTYALLDNVCITALFGNNKESSRSIFTIKSECDSTVCYKANEKT